jgi:hypothetical protein
MCADVFEGAVYLYAKQETRHLCSEYVKFSLQKNNLDTSFLMFY